MITLNVLWAELPVRMVHDPHSRDEPMFECFDCGRRVSGETDDRLCPECGGYMRNIGITRAE